MGALLVVLALLLGACTASGDAPADAAGERGPAGAAADAPGGGETAPSDGADPDRAGTGGPAVGASQDPAPARQVTGPTPPEPPASRAALVTRAERLVSAALEQADTGTLAILVTDEHGRQVVARDADTPVLPASTLKIATAAAALVTFGPEARFTTRVEATAPIDGDGVLRGELLLVGGGDPALATAEYGRFVYPARPRTPFEALADQLVAGGLVRVEGDVVGVAPDTGPAVAEGWPDRYFSSLDARYHAALTLDAGLRTIVEHPEPDEADDPDAPEGSPQPDDGPVVATPVVAAPDDVAPSPAPPEPPRVRVDHARDPAAHAAAELARLLAERGVEVVGRPRTGEPTGAAVGRLASVQSPPMSELLRFAMQRSDNQLTDGIFRAVGAARTGDGSFAGGARGLVQVLDGLGVDTSALHLADGSGLSRDDRLSVRTLVELDRAMLASRHAATWGSLMAVMGQSGTLDTRLRGTVAQGRFAGKTGTLRDVSGLVGTARGPGGARYHLAVIANDEGAARWIGRTLTDELVLLLVADLEGCAVTDAGETPGTLGVPPLAVRCA